MKRSFSILLLLIAVTAHAQHATVRKDTVQTVPLYKTISLRTPFYNTIPADYYTHHFGFFCRQELKMQKAHIPVSVRLGSMDYVNRLEQKTKTP